jgi:hypothetical protein
LLNERQTECQWHAPAAPDLSCFFVEGIERKKVVLVGGGRPAGRLAG